MQMYDNYVFNLKFLEYPKNLLDESDNYIYLLSIIPNIHSVYTSNMFIQQESAYI